MKVRVFKLEPPDRSAKQSNKEKGKEEEEEEERGGDEGSSTVVEVHADGSKSSEAVSMLAGILGELLVSRLH